MTEQEPYAGMWDFAASCSPGTSAWRSQITFTLGIFQWEARLSGHGLKRGKVQLRVKGYTGEPERAFEKARAICAERNTVKRASE
jgi:hypothetical protein